MAMDVTQFYAAAKAAGMLSSATWTPSGGSPTPLDVLYANDAAEVLGMEANGPHCRVPRSFVMGAKQGDAMTVGGINYSVATIMLDTPHLGESMLIFRK
jgi:hypothetical protein